MKKGQIWEIGDKIVLFIRALGLLITKVVKQIVLPNRKRKGNLLSSLLLFFISLNDLVVTFSWGFSVRFVLRWKHYDRAVFLAKRAMLFAGFALFLLSSFEWSYPEAPELTHTNSVVQTGLDAHDRAPKKTVQYHTAPLRNTGPAWGFKNIKAYRSTCGHAPLITSKIYLHHGNFRI
ncbi:MAG: hypothetical protein EPN39_01080 [Chitinophagaceae bacterium]|nr:MAG: hypothetical protein EPN39_01080 [Chitinophagaceae bacterium]